LLFRAATLKGRVSGDSYLYAESAMVLSRLPDRFRLRLESGSDPIGRILSEEGIAVTREALEGPGLPAIAIPSGVTMSAADDILTRTYRVDIDGIPAMAIAEWFLTSLTRFLPAQGD
jgi:chorismate-pyruvate lyase